MAWLRPGPTALVLLAAAAYGWALVRSPLGAAERAGRGGAFAAGAAVAWAALGGPVGALVARGVFSARVAQDVLLAFGAVPLCIAGLPAAWVRRALRGRRARRVAAATCRPVPAILVFHAVLFLGLLPASVGLLQRLPALSAAAAAVLAGTAAQMWAPLMVDVPELPGPAAGIQLLYLFFNWLLVTIAFAFLLFDHGLPYDAGSRAVLPFGFTPDQDRQLGAVALGLASHAAYLVALGAIFVRWAEREAATASPGHVYERLRGGGWTDAEARRIAGLPPSARPHGDRAG